MPQATLEIGFYNWGENQYAINLRLSRSWVDADMRVDVLGMPLENFDRQRFLPLQSDPKAYGKLLSSATFPDRQALTLFTTALTSAQDKSVPLRVQLLLSPSMPYLHDLRWESLCDPRDEDGPFLFMRDDILFSRYLSSMDSRPILPRPNGEQLRALAVIANPGNLDRYHLRPLDIERETDRIDKGLVDVVVTRLSPSTGPVTLECVLEELCDAQAAYDVLYLVCHGTLKRGEPQLWLEDDSHVAEVVSGAEFCSRLMELNNRPRLVVLVSCESGGMGDDGASPDGALAALGPRLAQAGIPAVVAMQGRISVETMDAFMPVFFHTLQEDGRIDLAMARARGTVRDRPDAWMPVLFTRLTSGRLWNDPHLRMVPGGENCFDGWTALLGNIELGKCTPILGAGMLDHLLGTSREIAQGWADVFRFPLAQNGRESLPEVAQYLAVTLGMSVSKNELGAYLHRQLLRRFQARIPDLPQRTHDSPPGTQLTTAISAAGQWLRDNDPYEPHRVLAELRCPVYVSTNPDRLMEDALKDAGTDPRMGMFNRSPSSSRRRRGDDESLDEESDEPLVYHLFGLFTKPDSVVLGQDEYFEYLVASVNEKLTIPYLVNEALTNSSLLFLGFQPTDWDFRVLMHSIRDRGGNSQLRNYEHVAVQIDPLEGQILDPEMARRYLQKLCRFDVSRISIYWGSVESFAKELATKRCEQLQMV